MTDEGHYTWDWRETPEWQAVETAVANLINLDLDGGQSMLTDFVLVSASVPQTTETDLVGQTHIFCSSKYAYVAKGLLAEGVDMARDLDEAF